MIATSTQYTHRDSLTMCCIVRIVKLPLLLKELMDVDWKAFGRALGTPEPIIQAILQQNPHSISRCWIDLMDHWMDNSKDVSWAAVAKALEKMFQKPHAERIIRKYCIKSTMQTDGANGKDLIA